MTIIEFDGRQHFEPIEYFGGVNAFEIGKIRDKIKNEWCKEKGFPLLRIPYYDRKYIDIILKSFLNDLNVIL